MEICNTGCSDWSILHDTVNNISSNARINFMFTLTRPNNIDPYTKYLDIYAGEEYSFSHRAVVVITGDYDKGELFSVGLPTHKPLLVLRDPPGGLSYAYYKNVQTIIRTDKKDNRVNVANKNSLGVAGVTDIEVDGCVGAGAFGVVAIACQSMLDTKIGNGITYENRNDFLASIDHASNTGSFTIEWSYQTSQDPWMAGRRSDAFLVPNLNVVFREVDVITFNNNNMLREQVKIRQLLT